MFHCVEWALRVGTLLWCPILGRKHVNEIRTSVNTERNYLALTSSGPWVVEICTAEFVCFSQKSVGVIMLTSTRGSSRSRSKDLAVVLCLDADLFTHLAGLPPLGGVKDPRKRKREKSRVQRQECQQMAPPAQERTVSCLLSRGDCC